MFFERVTHNAEKPLCDLRIAQNLLYLILMGIGALQYSIINVRGKSAGNSGQQSYF